MRVLVRRVLTVVLAVFIVAFAWVAGALVWYGPLERLYVEYLVWRIKRDCLAPELDLACQVDTIDYGLIMNGVYFTDGEHVYMICPQPIILSYSYCGNDSPQEIHGR